MITLKKGSRVLSGTSIYKTIITIYQTVFHSLENTREKVVNEIETVINCLFSSIIKEKIFWFYESSLWASFMY